MRSRFAFASLLLALATSPPADGQTGGFTRYLGGGPASTDCMLVTDVAGASGRRTASCTDGDPLCDADGKADGTCVFSVRLCLDAVDSTLPRCHADLVTQAGSSFPALAAALQVLAMPAAPDTCTDAVAVPVIRHGRRGRLVLQASAHMASGHSDRDHVALLCRRPATATMTTFATLQQKIFTPSCAIASCHGAAGAGGLGLTADAAYADLVGVAPANDAARAAGLLRVAPGDPDRSFLLQKLDGTLGAGEGQRMPQVGSALPAAAIDLVRRWIAAGAPATAGF